MFRVAKQQPLVRGIPRRCPALPHKHFRVARGSAPNRWNNPIPIGRTTCRVIRRPSFASSAPSALRSPAPGLAIGAQLARVDSVGET